jgi:hypothetical protein
MAATTLPLPACSSGLVTIIVVLGTEPALDAGHVGGIEHQKLLIRFRASCSTGLWLILTSSLAYPTRVHQPGVISLHVLFPASGRSDRQSD